MKKEDFYMEDLGDLLLKVDEIISDTMPWCNESVLEKIFDELHDQLEDQTNGEYRNHN